jgi:nicotinate dehydrogenase subunit B
VTSSVTSNVLSQSVVVTRTMDYGGRTGGLSVILPYRYLIINPDGLRRCIEGNVVQGTSRALSEEVAFDRARVTSTDWLSYPILDIAEEPEAVDIVLLNRPDLPPAGAGESSIRPVAAAIGNAVFDATVVRLRRAPLTPERLKPALA